MVKKTLKQSTLSITKYSGKKVIVFCFFPLQGDPPSRCINPVLSMHRKMEGQRSVPFLSPAFLSFLSGASVNVILGGHTPQDWQVKIYCVVSWQSCLSLSAKNYSLITQLAKNPLNGYFKITQYQHILLMDECLPFVYAQSCNQTLGGGPSYPNRPALIIQKLTCTPVSCFVDCTKPSSRIL